MRRFRLGALLGIAASAAALALAAPASANDIKPLETVFGTDMKAAGFGGMRGNGNGTLTISGVSGPVSKALLYWHGPTNTADLGANATIMFNGSPTTGTNIGRSSDNCWGFANSQAYRADVTSKVTGNGAYTLANLIKPGVEINGASLLVFYNDADTTNSRDVVLFDGNDSNQTNPFDAPGWNVQLAGINYSGGDAAMVLHVSDGQSFPDAAVVVNGSTLAPAGPVFQGTTVPNGPSAGSTSGGLWDIRSFTVTSLLTPGENTLELKSGINSDCLSLIVAAVDLPAGAAPREFELDIDPKDATNPAGTSHTVTATLTDQDGPAKDESILFSVTGANPGSGTATTAADGKAGFTWTGTNAGDDTVVACHDADKDSTCDEGEQRVTAKKTWTKRATQVTANPVILRVSGLKIYLAPTAKLEALNPTAPLGGKTLVFKAGSTTLCSATTAADGTAGCTGVVPLLQSILALGDYTATFAGDGQYTGSSDKGALIK